MEKRSQRIQGIKESGEIMDNLSVVYILIGVILIFTGLHNLDIAYNVKDGEVTGLSGKIYTTDKSHDSSLLLTSFGLVFLILATFNES